MGLIKATTEAIGGSLSDQWKEMVYSDALPVDVLVRRGSKRIGDRSSNVKSDDNIISNGSIVIVNDGQCALIVEQGNIVDFCAEQGEYVFDTSLAPSLFAGSLGKSVVETFKNIGRRITFGGDAGVDQRVYYVNVKEIVGNKYGTVSPIPFRVIDQNIDLDIDISVRCNGEFSFKIVDPLLFYRNVCGNVEYEFNRDEILGQLRSELLTALQPAFAQIGVQGIRYSEIPAHASEVSIELNSILSQQWAGLRGIQIVKFGINAIAADSKDEDLIKNLQKSAVMRDPTMAAAVLANAQAEAMVGAANNTNAGAFAAFAGLNMAQSAAGNNITNLFSMGQAQPVANSQVSSNSWTCKCGTVNSGNFCQQCGSSRVNGGSKG